MSKSQTRSLARLAVALASLLLAACASVEESPVSPVAPVASPQPVCPVCLVCQKCPELPPTTVVPPPAKPLQPAQWSDLPGWGDDDLVAAWPAFLNSCRALVSKPQWLLWRAACEEAATLPATDNARLRSFFETRFTPYQLVNPDATTSGLVTGYYEPLLHGARRQSAVFSQPVLGVPTDLLTIDLADVVPDVKNLRLRGRLQG
ncbi:MAG: MltA domain-containing protein, partial [Propionivibrio sp.]